MEEQPVTSLGYEIDTLGSSPDPVRWWLYVQVPGRRYQPARRGVIDRGFRFARGGRAASGTDAQLRLEEAKSECLLEMRRWNHQPSHALGPDGSLIPLDELVARQLEAS